MTRRAAFFVVGLVAAALVGVALLAVPGSPIHQKPSLGLDLQGGLEVTLQAVPPRDRKLTKDDLDRSVPIIRDRVDKLGVSEPEIRTQGNDQIAIQLPGVKTPPRRCEVIGSTAQLGMYDLERDLVPPSVDARTGSDRDPKLYDLLVGQQALASKGDTRRVVPLPTRASGSSSGRCRRRTRRCRRSAASSRQARRCSPFRRGPSSCTAAPGDACAPAWEYPRRSTTSTSSATPRPPSRR